MAVEAHYTHPIQVVETEQMRDRIKAISDRERISQAQVIRDILASGIGERETVSLHRAGIVSCDGGCGRAATRQVGQGFNFCDHCSPTSG